MKKIYFISAVFAASLSLVSCERNVLVPSDNETGTYGNHTFYATFEDCVTKTQLGPKDNLSNKYPVYWSENDKIKIFAEGAQPGEGREFTLTAGAGTAQGTFNGTLNANDEGTTYYALYPYSTSASLVYGNYGFATGVFFELPQEQTYYPGTFDKKINPAVAYTTTDELSFKNICGVLKLSITGNAKVSRISLRSLDNNQNGVCLWGPVKASITGEYEKIIRQYSWGPDGDQNQINLNCTTPVQLGETPTDFFFVVSPSADQYWNSNFTSGLEVTVYDENNTVVAYKEATVGNTIKRAKVREMPVFDIRKKTLTDLSANGTANCYIVKPDGRSYSFYALQKGNGAYPIENADNVVVLFRTYNSSVAPNETSVVTGVTFDKETGYISFTSEANIPDNPETEGVNEFVDKQGSALIAIRDASHNILWSWHIWSSDIDESLYEGYDGISALMDRNLGAKSSADYGFWYEWGRKDPFIRIHPTGDIHLDYTTYPEVVFDRANTEGVSDIIAYSVLNPTTWIPSDGRWADHHIAKWSSEKTMYDPCPVGWKVADMETFVYRGSYIFYDQDSGIFNNNYTYVAENGVSYKYPKTNPENPGFYTNYMGRALYATYLSDRVSTTYSSHPKAVRCQKEGTGRTEDKDMIEDLSRNGTANCYMVHKLGSYKFKADVKGNSNESVGHGSRVRVTWISNSGGEKPLREDEYSGFNATYKDGYIYFRTAFKWMEGSAILSLCDNDDVNDENPNILWSWHIWFTKYEPIHESAYDIVPASDGETSRKMMKINLGATYNDAIGGERGMMYQWGRKDPFVAALSFNNNTPAEGGEYDTQTSSATTGTIRYSIEHPGTIIKGDGNANPQVKDWLNSHDNSLWGSTKTKYDPCPPGWQVPPAITWAQTHVVTGLWNDTGKHGVSNIRVDSNLYEIYFPAAGYRFYGSGKIEKTGEEGHYWYATAHDDDTAHAFYFSGTGIHFTGHTDNKAQCNPVRCMKIQN